MKNVIYRLRTEKGMTQQQVAKLLNISQQAYQRYENTDIRSISTETLLKLTEIFDTTISYLLELDKDQENTFNNKNLINQMEPFQISEDKLNNERNQIIELVKKLSYYSCLEARANIVRLIARDEQEKRYWKNLQEQDLKNKGNKND